MNNKSGHWVNFARHTRSPNEKIIGMASGAMLWHTPKLHIIQQRVWPLSKALALHRKIITVTSFIYYTVNCVSVCEIR